MKYYLERRDPEFESKMREVLLVYQEVALQNQNGGIVPVIVTVSVDEKPGLQAIANTGRICRRYRESIRVSVGITSTSVSAPALFWPHWTCTTDM